VPLLRLFYIIVLYDAMAVRLTTCILRADVCRPKHGTFQLSTMEPPRGSQQWEASSSCLIWLHMMGSPISCHWFPSPHQSNLSSTRARQTSCGNPRVISFETVCFHTRCIRPRFDHRLHTTYNVPNLTQVWDIQEIVLNIHSASQYGKEAPDIHKTPNAEAKRCSAYGS
jgi:hypothetical protein